MPLWVIEVRTAPSYEWEVAGVEWEKEMAQVIQDELEADAVGEIRAREVQDLPQEEGDALIKRVNERTVDVMDRWEVYRFKAIERLHREGR